MKKLGNYILEYSGNNQTEIKTDCDWFWHELPEPVAA